MDIVISFMFLSATRTAVCLFRVILCKY